MIDVDISLRITSQGMSSSLSGLRPFSSSLPSSFLLPRAADGSGSTSSSSTPSLSFSPASTESSGGDQTIQMSSFIDVLPQGCGAATTTTAQSSWAHLSKKIVPSPLSMVSTGATTADTIHLAHTAGSPLVPIDPRRAAHHDNGIGSGNNNGGGFNGGFGAGDDRYGSCSFINGSHAIHASTMPKHFDSMAFMATGTAAAAATTTATITATTMAAPMYTQWASMLG
jgi:hypothetical protein